MANSTDSWWNHIEEITNGTGTESDPYIIENGGQLVWYMYASGRYGRLSKSIYLDDYKWDITSGYTNYAGNHKHLDGAGFGIYNLDSSTCGLFLKTTMTSTNISLKNCHYTAYMIDGHDNNSGDDYGYCGGLIWYTHKSSQGIITVYNCDIEIHYVYTYSGVGALVGYSAASTCKINIECSTVAFDGWIHPENTSDAIIGGLVGYTTGASNITVKNVNILMTGILEYTGSPNTIGGVIGRMYTSSNNYPININNLSVSIYDMPNVSYIGGIVGYCTNIVTGSSYRPYIDLAYLMRVDGFVLNRFEGITSPSGSNNNDTGRFNYLCGNQSNGKASIATASQYEDCFKNMIISKPDCINASSNDTFFTRPFPLAAFNIVEYDSPNSKGYKYNIPSTVASNANVMAYESNHRWANDGTNSSGCLVSEELKNVGTNNAYDPVRLYVHEDPLEVCNSGQIFKVLTHGSYWGRLTSTGLKLESNQSLSVSMYKYENQRYDSTATPTLLCSGEYKMSTQIPNMKQDLLIHINGIITESSYEFKDSDSTTKKVVDVYIKDGTVLKKLALQGYKDTNGVIYF